MEQNDYVVYVLDKEGNPLMPTKRFGKVRRMLDDGRAVCTKRKPFTIRLTYESKKHFVDPVCVGIDPGRTNIGIAAESNGRCLYLAHCKTRNKEIPHEMGKRKTHRQASRSGERKRRKRRAKANGTEMKVPVKQNPAKQIKEEWDEKQKRCRVTVMRILPKCEKISIAKDIINTEARFCNRKREAGWLTPTATQLLRTCENLVRQVCKILPITDVAIEMNKFAFMAMDDPTIWNHKTDFQNGPLKGHSGVNDAVDAMQKDKCLLCGGKIEHHHHIIPKSQGGSDTIANIAGICFACHDLIHKDKKAFEALSTAFS